MRRVLKRRGLRAAAVAVAAAVALVLSGCSASALDDQGDCSAPGIGCVNGTGTIEIPLAKRGKPVDFGGMTQDGTSWEAKSARGKVVVVNFWYADCSPCRQEATALQKIYSDFAAQGVEFIGVNTRDAAPRVTSFDQKFGVTYPSLLDADSGSAQLAFAGTLRPNSTPTTIVLDTEGRIAARMEGSITIQPSTLETLIKAALAGQS